MGTNGTSRAARWALLAAVVAVLAIAFWGALAARTVVVNAQAAREHVERLEVALAMDGQGAPSPDLDEASRAASAADAHAERAAAAARSLPLHLAGWLPFVGDDVRAVQDVTAAVHTVTSASLPPLLDVAATFDPSALVADDGGIDLGALRAAAPDAEVAADAARQALERIEGIDDEGLLPVVRGPVEETRTGLAELADRSAMVASVLEVLPGALGAEEPRTYLLAFQNLAEARPTGGIVGAWALLQLSEGRIELVETGANDDLEELRGPARDLGEEVSAMYGSDLTLSQNVNLSPHFPHAAVLLSDLWQAQGRPAPHGVVAVDPVALAHLLGATGPVAVPGGPDVSADDVVHVLQAEAYEMFDGRDALRRAYLAQVTTAVFAAATERGLGDPALLEALLEAAREQHLQVWAADEKVQDVVERAGIAGLLPEPSPQAVLLTLTNVDASKLDHYVDIDVSCQQDELAVTLASAAPPTVPDYVRNRLAGAVPTTHRVVLDLWLPPQRGVDAVLVDGRHTEIGLATLRGWTVARLVVDVARDDAVDVRWQMVGVDDPPVVDVQPLTTPPEINGCSESSFGH